MDTNTETVTFNVGGQKYEISRSQFDKYPDSMLAKTVSDRWLEDPSQEIFIDRDESLFSYVLSFIRDGKVFLPMYMVKGNFIKELEYYGIECDDNSSAYIHEKPFLSINDIDAYIQRLRNEQENNKARNCNIDIAIYCMKAYYGGRFRSLGLPISSQWSYKSKVAKWVLWNCENDKDDYECIHEAWNATTSTQYIKHVAEVNKILNKVSLKLISMTKHPNINNNIHYSFEMTEILD